MMTNFKIKVIGIICIMIYEDLIFTRYYFEISFKIGSRYLTISNIVLSLYKIIGDNEIPVKKPESPVAQ